jgi:acetyl-CoA acetyltransferase
MTDKAAPRWWRCDTHGPGNHTAWGCPECVREMRAELRRLRARVLELEAVHEDSSGAVLQERERCAALCLGIAEVIASSANGARKEAGMRAAESCAWAIRSNAGDVVRVA